MMPEDSGQPEIPATLSPNPPDSCPLFDLLSVDVEQMTLEELKLHVSELRKVVESPQTLKAAIKCSSSTSKKAVSGEKLMKDFLADDDF